MIEAIKQKLSESADLVVNWLTNNGMNLAGRILAALVILLVGALVILLARAVFLKRDLVRA